MEQLDGDQCRYTNTVTSHPTEGFLKFIAEQGQTFEEAAKARQEASGKHCAFRCGRHLDILLRFSANIGAGHPHCQGGLDAWRSRGGERVCRPV